MNNYGIREIEKTIEEMKLIGLVGVGTEATIVRVDDSYIEEFSDFSYPIIHDTVEALLYYLTWTDRLIEFDYYLSRFLEEKDTTDFIIVNMINKINNMDLLNKLDKILSKNKIGNEKYFNGWTTNKSSYNFHMSFDFILLDSVKLPRGR